MIEDKQSRYIGKEMIGDEGRCRDKEQVGKQPQAEAGTARGATRNIKQAQLCYECGECRRQLVRQDEGCSDPGGAAASGAGHEEFSGWGPRGSL